MRGALSPLSQYAFMAWCPVKKQRDNFTSVATMLHSWVGFYTHTYTEAICTREPVVTKLRAGRPGFDFRQGQ
jgi:hypothetical protein